MPPSDHEPIGLLHARPRSVGPHARAARSTRISPPLSTSLSGLSASGRSAIPISPLPAVLLPECRGQDRSSRRFLRGRARSKLNNSGIFFMPLKHICSDILDIANEYIEIVDRAWRIGRIIYRCRLYNDRSEILNPNEFDYCISKWIFM